MGPWPMPAEACARRVDTFAAARQRGAARTDGKGSRPGGNDGDGGTGTLLTVAAALFVIGVFGIF